MTLREIKLIESSVKNGRIYFPSSDINFFPADSYSDRGAVGHKVKPVKFYVGDRVLETDIRICSGKRISPRKSMGFYFKQIDAKVGAYLRVTRISEREYKIEYI